MTSSLRQLVLMQFKEYWRDPEMIFWTLGFPIALAWILGIAFVNQDQFSRPVAWVRPAVGTVPAALTPGQVPLIEGHDLKFAWQELPSPEAALQGVKRGRFPLYLARDEPSGRWRYYFDPANREAQLSFLLLSRAPGPDEAVPLRATGSRYIDFLIPGLIALGIMNSCLWGIGWALIERRMKKLLRRMLATPLPRAEFLLSYFITRFLFTTVEIGVLLAFALAYFKIRVQGSWAAFALLAVCGNLAFGGIAVLMACRTQNSQTGNGLLNAISMPMMLLSGIFFSYYNFPEWMSAWVQWLPLTLLADGLRQVFIEGAGLAQAALPASLLLGTGAGAFLLGLRWFKWY